MTTPARNINSFLNRQGFFYQKTTCAGGFALQNSTSNHWKQYVDVRPASINNPMTRNGWRNPSAWSHDHLEAIVSPIGEMDAKLWCANRSQYTGHRYIDGEYATDNGMLTLLTGPPSWVGNLATTRAYLALKNQNANLSEAFAERHQAKQMVSNAARDIAKQVERFRRRNPRDWGQVIKNGLKTQWKDIPNRWLELQYGWKPMMSDIFGTLQNLDMLESGANPYWTRVKGAAKLDENQTIPFASNPYWWKEYAIRHHHVKTVLFYRLNAPPLATLASLGLTNPLLLGWELVRYSFVVDWFLPVGNWLSTLDADFGWNYLTGCQSTFTRLGVDSVPGAIPDTSTAEYRNYTLGPYASGYRFRRTVLGSPPGVGLPHFKNPLSSQHIANALSLLSQAFRK